MIGLATVFLSGLLFAAGLGVSGMTLPQKVIGFLDFAGGDWDPSLGFVMVSSAGVFLLLHRLVLRRERPVFDTEFHVPTRTDIDAPLVFGATLFGIGWGMVGLCPGPAVTALASGQTPAWIFFVAMIAGMYAEGTLKVTNRVMSGGGQTVDG
jgi:uncharacterized membrane protein YedE/YeeE